MSSPNHSLLTYPVTENVPQILKNFLRWGIGSVVVFCILSMICFTEHRHALQTIGSDSAPSVVAAHKIQQHVLSMDTQMVSNLASKPGENYASTITGKNGYEAWRKAVSDEIVAASQNITYPGEREQLVAIQEAMSDFTSALNGAFLYRYNDNAASVAQYRAALKVLETKLIPATQELDRLNTEQLDKSFSRVEAWSWVAVALNFVAGAALIGFIVVFYRFISKHFKLGVQKLWPLAVCLGLSVWFTGYTTVQYYRADSLIKTAKLDAFDSVAPLMDLESLGYQAKAASARWFYDDAMRPKHRTSMTKAENDILKVKDRATMQQVISEVSSTADMGANPCNKSGFAWSSFDGGGKFAKEFCNITFDGEKQAAMRALSLWAQWVAIEDGAQAAETADHDGAVAQATGAQQGQGGYVFDAFVKAVEDTTNINMAHFQSSINAGNDAISGLFGFATLWEIAFIQAVLQLLLCWYAYQARQREFA